MSDLSALMRCTRCGEALTPRTTHHDGTVIIRLEGGETDGPCISPVDGSAEPTHRYVTVEARTEGTPIPLLHIVEVEFFPGAPFDPPQQWEPGDDAE
jgi:hypothetical protein